MTGADTVARADVTPGGFQPYDQLGLADAEYARILGILGRRPTSAELAPYPSYGASTARTSRPRCT